MFERFTDRARSAVAAAQEHSRRLGHTWIGTEHLLLALAEGDGVSARALRQLGFDRARFEQATVDQVGQGHRVGLTGHIPFTPRSKKVLEEGLRQALAMGHTWIGTEHLVLGLMEDDSSLATKLVVEQGISAAALKAAVVDLLAAMTPAVEEEGAAGEPVDLLVAAVPDAEVARCSGCRAALAPNLGADVMSSVGEVERFFTVAYCRACGHVLAVLPDD
jgi:ATP-dependent Clp protease ATP-binding subunit ClpC